MNNTDRIELRDGYSFRVGRLGNKAHVAVSTMGECGYDARDGWTLDERELLANVVCSKCVNTSLHYGVRWFAGQIARPTVDLRKTCGHANAVIVVDGFARCGSCARSFAKGIK